jgi:hypothetical protein
MEVQIAILYTYDACPVLSTELNSHNINVSILVTLVLYIWSAATKLSQKMAL